MGWLNNGEGLAMLRLKHSIPSRRARFDIITYRTLLLLRRQKLLYRGDKAEVFSFSTFLKKECIIQRQGNVESSPQRSQWSGTAILKNLVKSHGLLYRKLRSGDIAGDARDWGNMEYVGHEKSQVYILSIRELIVISTEYNEGMIGLSYLLMRFIVLNNG